MPPRRLGLLALGAALPLVLSGCLSPPAPGPAEPVEPTQEPVDEPPAGPNLPPVARFDWTPDPGIAGQAMVFVDRSSDPDDGIGGRVWEFPDGVTSPMARVTHVFGQPGRYLVKLTVSDRGGQTDTAAREVLVVAVGQGTLPPHEDLGPRPHVVVAVVDTGINPYHEVFRSAEPWGPPASFVEGYPPEAEPLPVTLGKSYAEARKADEGVWAQAQVGRLYYVPGTRILGAISFGLSTFGNAAPNQVPVLDEDGHGTATSSRVALSSPHALLVMVETGAEELDEAIAWASTQPWIDIVSISVGPLGNVPAQWPATRLGALRLATLDAWKSGKLVFAAAGNEPTLSATSYISGPPWVVAVGGALPEGQGEPGTASKAMDIVSDYAPLCARHDSTDASERRTGTSFAAPTAAGAVAEALHQLRSEQGWPRGIVEGKLLGGSGTGLLQDGLTNAELRGAIEGVATYWDTADWQPAVGLPIAPAPWLQMGWGYLGAGDASGLAHALRSDEVSEKPGEARLYMASVMAFREFMWG